MKRSRYLVLVWCVTIGIGYGQSVELARSSEALSKRWFGTGLDMQTQAYTLSVSNFLARMGTVLPLPLGMVRLGLTNSYYVTLAGDFVDYEYRIVATVSNETMVSTITWIYSLSQNDRAYNFLRSLPYLSQTTVWWQSRTNKTDVYTIWKEKNTYIYMRVIKEKDNTLERGFLITIEVMPIKKLSSQAMDEFVWDYVMTSDWRDVERLLR